MGDAAGPRRSAGSAFDGAAEGGWGGGGGAFFGGGGGAFFGGACDGGAVAVASVRATLGGGGSGNGAASGSAGAPAAAGALGKAALFGFAPGSNGRPRGALDGALGKGGRRAGEGHESRGGGQSSLKLGPFGSGASSFTCASWLALTDWEYGCGPRCAARD